MTARALVLLLLLLPLPGCGDNTAPLPPGSARGAGLLLPWSALSGRIALVVDSGQSGAQLPEHLLLIDAGERQVRELRQFRADQSAFDMAFSPDGSQLSLTVRDSLSDAGHVEVLNVSDGRTTQTLPGASCHRWLSDGRTSWRRGDTLIVNDAVVGTPPHTSVVGGSARCPSWLPDGTAFIALVDEPTGDRVIAYTTAVYRISVPDLAAQRLIGWASTAGWDGAWFAALASPSGTGMALVRFWFYQDPAYQHIWLAHADGTALRQLTSASASGTSPSQIGDLAWSPTGAQLVAASYGDGAFIFNAADRSLQRLTAAQTHAVAWAR